MDTIRIPVTSDILGRKEVHDWLISLLGPHRSRIKEIKDWVWWTEDHGALVCFRYAKDAMLFKLTWL